jgi:hypothetical protein
VHFTFAGTNSGGALSIGHSISPLATDVKAEVYLIEIRVKRNSKGLKEFRAAKPKAYEAKVCFSKERIQHSAAGDILVQQRGWQRRQACTCFRKSPVSLPTERERQISARRSSQILTA